MSAFGQTSKDQSTPLSRFFSYVKQVLVGVAALLAVAYVGDYLAVRVRIATNHAAYGVVQVHRSYAVTMKNGKPEYFFDPPANQTCFHSLFPHFGYPPCWYLGRKAVQQVKM